MTTDPYQLIDSIEGDRVEQLHALYQQVWWAKQRSLEDTHRMLEYTSLVFGIVESTTDDAAAHGAAAGRLVAFCRVMTDFTFRAMIYDVIVDERLRGAGLGRRLIDAVMEHPRVQPISMVSLTCKKEKVPLYEKWGFRIVEQEEQFLMRKVQHEG